MLCCCRVQGGRSGVLWDRGEQPQRDAGALARLAGCEATVGSPHPSYN